MRLVLNDKSLELFNRMIDYALEYPELSPDRVLIIDMDLDTWKSIVTPSRMELIRIIRDKKPKSVGELAKLSKRPVESVSRDIKILEVNGVLEIIRVGRFKKPVIEKDILVIPLTA